MLVDSDESLLGRSWVVFRLILESASWAYYRSRVFMANQNAHHYSKVFCCSDVLDVRIGVVLPRPAIRTHRKGHSLTCNLLLSACDIDYCTELVLLGSIVVLILILSTGAFIVSMDVIETAAVDVDVLTLEDLLNADDGVLEAPLNMETFIKYCKTQYMEEYILFYNEVKALQRSGSRCPRLEFLSHISFISSTYIEENSAWEISISRERRQQTLKSVRGYFSSSSDEQDIDFFVPGVACFDAALHEAIHTMKTEIWPHFLEYANLRKRISLNQDTALWWRQKGRLNWSEFWSFPSPVNVLESRIHSFCTALLIGVSVLLTWKCDFHYLQLLIVYGFLARTLAGPRLDPQSLLILLVLRPLVEDKIQMATSSFVPSGAPFRFAQFTGFVFGVTATVLQILGLWRSSYIIWGVFFVVATLAAVTGICIACSFFQMAARLGLISKFVTVSTKASTVSRRTSK